MSVRFQTSPEIIPSAAKPVRSSRLCCLKALKVALRVFTSPIFWAGIQIIGIAVFAAVVWSGKALIPLSIGLIIVGVGIITISIYLAVYKKRIVYEGSLIGTMGRAAINRKKKWCNKITNNVYLGMIPLKNRDHHLLLKQLGISVVVTYLENFELKNGVASEPVQPEDWVQLGIDQKRIPAADFKPMSFEEIQQGVERIREAKLAGKNVYVHCKAGVGRSATAIICYTYEYESEKLGLKTFEDVYQFVRKQRPQVKLNKKQRAAALAFCDQITKQ